MAALLLNRFLQIADRLPEKTAVIWNESNTSYGTLRQRTLQIASHLRTLLQPGDRVALVQENSPDYIASCYGIWAANGVVVALNTALKEPEILNLLSHCTATVCVVDAKYSALRIRLRDLGIKAVVVGTEDSAVSLHDNEAKLYSLYADTPMATSTAANDTGAPAAIIYTSGTTGHPKGVVLSHGNLAENTLAIQCCLPLEQDDRALCLLPFFYSFGNSILHTHLSAGATLVLINSLMYPQEVLRQMAEYNVTSFYGVPSTYYLLLGRTRLQPDNLRSLRYCAQAGGGMDKNRIEQFCSTLPWVDFFVMYGQTEATARLSYLPPSKRADKAGSVGVAVPGMELSIRDDRNEELPAMQTGEVCTRGTSVMLGYWQDDIETTKAIKYGWLRTGDLGYRDADGYLYLTGRSSEIIKAGAYRISPLELEEVIGSIAGVREVAVVGVSDQLLGEAIKACVVADDQEESLRMEILRRCRAELPLYKVPKTVEFYAELPKTASGKVKKHLLR